MSFSLSYRPTILGRLRTATTIEYIPAAILLLLLLLAPVPVVLVMLLLPTLMCDRPVAGLGERRNSLLRVDVDYGDGKREERRFPRGGLSYAGLHTGLHAGLSYYIAYAGECDPAPRTRLYTANIIWSALPKCK